MGPINYRTDVQDPFQAALQGYQGGAAIRDDQMQQQMLQAKLAEQERARLAQMQMQQELAALSANPNAGARDFAAINLKYPQLREPIKQAFDMISKDRQSGVVDMSSRALAAVENGRPDVAEQILRDRAAAMRNSGNEDGAKPHEMWADMIKENPNGARLTLHRFLSGVMDPDKYATTFAGLGAEARAAEKAPGELRKTNADAAKAEADATTATVTAENAPATAAADLAQKQADATTKGVTAKYAEQMSVSELQKRAADLGLTKAQTSQAIALTKKYGAETQKIAMDLAAGGSADPAKRFEAEQKLRKEYVEGTKTYVEVSDAYRRILASKDDAVGDLSLIFGYMKMLDPGSVVREGEFATAQNAAGVPDRILNTYNRVMRGERLNAKQRESFKGQAGELFKTAETREKEVRAGLSRVADSYKLDKDNIFGSKVEQAAPASPAPAAAPVKISGDADFAKLPSGALFIGPDGKTRRKP